jgi:protein-tyrosine phosphatase
VGRQFLPNMVETVISLKGLYNFRDFGGYQAAGGSRVRRSMLYRSENLSRLSREALPQLNNLGIQLLIDFRSEYERNHRPNVLPPGGVPRVEHIPMSLAPELERRWSIREQAAFLRSGSFRRFGPNYMEAAYRRMALGSTEALSRLLKLLCDRTNYPILMLCAGGRDRTGFAAAVVLRALGTPVAEILEGYCFTNICTAPMLERRARLLRTLSLFRASKEELRDFMAVRPGYLMAALDEIDRKYGSFSGYLSAGLRVPAGALRELRGVLLEEE